MKNITISLDDETAARARVHAAERSMSLSRYVGEVLREQMRGRDEYERAMRRFFSRKPLPMRSPGERLPAREELHDRAALRRGMAGERKDRGK